MKNNQNDKYLKVIECLGEVLLNNDMTIQISEYETKALKKKIEQLEQFIARYEQSTNEETSGTALKQSI